MAPLDSSFSPKGRISLKSFIPGFGKKMGDRKVPNKSFNDHSGRRPLGKTPLGAPLSKTQVKAKNRNLMLVTVTILGSPGPLRFLVDRVDTVGRVIDMALRVYAHEGRLPLLNPKLVELYCDNGDFKALNVNETMGSLGTRQFLLYRKKAEEVQQKGNVQQQMSHSLKHWWSFVNSFACWH